MTASARTPTPNRRLRRALYESSTPSAKFSGLSAVDGGLQMSESSGIPARRKLSTNYRTLSREAKVQARDGVALSNERRHLQLLVITAVHGEVTIRRR